jgi:hypothetical protein
VICKEREEETREEEEKDHLAEIHLNFEKFKIWSKLWWWFAKMSSTSGRNHSTKFSEFLKKWK